MRVFFRNAVRLKHIRRGETSYGVGSTQATILDKINGTPGPPLPPIQCCQNGAVLLLRAFIIALGGMGDNCSTLFCPRL